MTQAPEPAIAPPAQPPVEPSPEPAPRPSPPGISCSCGWTVAGYDEKENVEAHFDHNCTLVTAPQLRMSVVISALLIAFVLGLFVATVVNWLHTDRWIWDEGQVVACSSWHDPGEPCSTAE